MIKHTVDTWLSNHERMMKNAFWDKKYLTERCKHMAALLDSQQIASQVQVELYEGGETWLVRFSFTETKEQPLAEIKLDASAAAQLLAFLRLHEDRLIREAGNNRGD